MKIKIAVVIAILVIVSIIMFICHPIEILQDVKLYKNLSGSHTLFYGSDRIGDIGGLDSWYVQGSQVYGVVSDEHNSKSQVNYFYINVCNGEKLITLNDGLFEDFLDKKGIDENRRNYMSGNNLINPQKLEYSKQVTCE